MRFEKPEYTTADFKKLLYPVFDIPEAKSIMEVLGNDKLNYPEFKVTIGAHGFAPGDKDRVIRYIACVYDMNSPFHKDYEDVNKRKIAACMYVGFEADDKGRFEDHVENMMLCRKDYIVDMIVRYCRNYRSLDYSLLVALWDDYYMKIKNIHNPDIEYKISDITGLRNEIIRLTEIFISGDDSEELIGNLYKHLEEESLGIRPEDIAMKLRDGVPGVTDKEISDYKSDLIKEV